MVHQAVSTRRKQPLIVSFAVLALLLVVIGAFLWFAWTAFTSLSPGVASASAVAFITAIASLGSLLYTRQSERRRDLEQELRRQKVPVYQDFMDFWFRFLHASRMGKQPASDAEIAEFAATFSAKIIIWGSDAVLKEYARFRSATGQGAGVNALLSFEKFLYAIRADVGHKNRGLSEGDLLSVFINDIDKVVKAMPPATVPADFAKSS